MSEETTSLSADDTVSSNYEPLPPPIPPHSVDPATLNEMHGTPITPTPHSPTASPFRSSATIDQDPEPEPFV